MGQPLISVLMTAYNTERFIAQSIESVLASTYSHFELIVVDDCSTDNTVKIAKSYSIADPRVKVYVNKENLGDYPNRNKAASYSSGKYLKYVDADDYIYPWGLEMLITMMEQFSEAGWGLCSLDQDVNAPFPILLFPKEAYGYAYFGAGLFHKAPLSSIIKREIFEKEGGFSGKQHLGDYELWHILALEHPVVLMPHGVVWHRVHNNQQSAENRRDPSIPFKYLISAHNFFKAEKRIPLSDKEKNKILIKNRFVIHKTIIIYFFKLRFLLGFKLISMTTNKKYNFKPYA